MKIYLDIDGTLIHEDLTENYGKPAKGLLEFLEALRLYDTYWLTTHCMEGNPENARNIMKKILPESYYQDIDRIKPTVWKDAKTEALDFGSDFIWFDNDIFPNEWKDLEKCRNNQGVIQVDLNKDPDNLIKLTSSLIKKT